jgi:hypothetical protein
MYIGRQPLVGNFVKLDAITTSATTTFNLTNGGVAYFPQSANNCLVSLNGILQAPTDSYTISGSTIVFSSALTTSDVIDFIIVLGDVLNIGTPSDNTVSLAKLTATGTKNSTTFLRGDNTFAEAGGGKLLQAITATDSTQRSTTSTSFVTGSNTLSVTITPASTSNKVFIICHSAISIAGAGYVWNGTIYRDSTNLGDATYGLGRFQMGSTGDRGSQMMFSYLDSPSSTSAITYQLYFKADGSTNYVNYAGTMGSITAFEIKG